VAHDRLPHLVERVFEHGDVEQAGRVLEREEARAPTGTGAWGLGALGFAAFGIFLGSVLPTARSAQAVRLLAWFIMMMLGGAGPPREVLTDEMEAMSDLTPLWHALRTMHEPWLGLDPGNAWWIFGGIALARVLLAWRFFGWE